MKLVWMSDLHFVAGKELVIGHDPRQRLEAAIKRINDHHSDADYCVISGDLVNRGTKSDYEELRLLLDQLMIPYLPMAGNHDNRSLLKSVLPIPEGMREFVQYSVDSDQGLILCLDSQKEGQDCGEFCRERSAWLEQELERASGKPALVFIHHPPVALGLPMQDQDRMEDGEAFLELLNKYSNVAHLFIGHVHRPIAGQMAGISFTTMRSVLYQAPAPVPVWDWGSFRPGQEAPAIGVVTADENSVIVQFEQFADFETEST